MREDAPQFHLAGLGEQIVHVAVEILGGLVNDQERGLLPASAVACSREVKRAL